MKISTLKLLLIIAFSLTMITCDEKENRTLATDLSNSTLLSFNNAITGLENESGLWREHLKTLIGSLTDETQSTLRIEVEALMASSISTVSRTASCQAVLLSKSIRNPLINIKNNISAFINGEKPKLESYSIICNVSPNDISKDDIFSNRHKVIQVEGYNLESDQVKVYLRSKNDSIVDITNHFHFTSHGAQIIDISSSGANIKASSKSIEIHLYGQKLYSIPLTESYKPCDKEVTIPKSTETFIPPHKEGDKDFYGHGPEVYASMKYIVSSSTIYLETYMVAKETKSTTKAEGNKSSLVYNAPKGYIIYEVISPASLFSERSYVDSNGNDDLFSGDSYSPVSDWTFVGDASGDRPESGTLTSVSANLNPIRLRLKRIDCDY